MAELYLFKRDAVNFGFTPTLEDKTLDGIVYVPALITRSNVLLTENFAKNNVTFSFERSHSFATELLHNFPETPVTVVLFKDSLPYWHGSVAGVQADSSRIDITCTNTYTSLSRFGTHAKLQLTCRHKLYSANCGVSQPVWKSSYAVSNVITSVISVSGLSEASGYFNGGIAILNGQTRHIRKHTGIDITISYPFTSNQSGTLDLYPGCALNEAACIGFSNLLNFGGQERLSDKNPFDATGLL